MSEPGEQRIERLGAADASNLGGGINHLVIGLCRLDRRADGTVPSFQEVRELIAERLGRSPRFRQFPYLPEGASGFPVWADTQEFDLDNHLVEAPVDGPVDRHELDVLLAEWMTTAIDETRPLWMVQYVPTLEGAALMVKSSHALADGLGSIALFAMLLFDISEEPERSDPVPWVPTTLPAASDLREAVAPGEAESGSSAQTPFQRAVSLLR